MQLEPQHCVDACRTGCWNEVRLLAAFSDLTHACGRACAFVLMCLCAPRCAMPRMAVLAPDVPCSNTSTAWMPSARQRAAGVRAGISDDAATGPSPTVNNRVEHQRLLPARAAQRDARAAFAGREDCGLHPGTRRRDRLRTRRATDWRRRKRRLVCILMRCRLQLVLVPLLQAGTWRGRCLVSSGGHDAVRGSRPGRDAGYTPSAH